MATHQKAPQVRPRRRQGAQKTNNEADECVDAGCAGKQPSTREARQKASLRRKWSATSGGNIEGELIRKAAQASVYDAYLRRAQSARKVALHARTQRSHPSWGWAHGGAGRLAGL